MYLSQALTQGLSRFYKCDIGPAPFSVAAVDQIDVNNADITLTVSEHCLQMATHFMRHPPRAMAVAELEELIVLALFHDVWYYGE